MNSSEMFKVVILKYLQERAEKDELFAKTFAKEGKNINDCVTYILNTVKKSECSGFTDDEVYSMAVHYYDEDVIEVGQECDATVIVNHQVQLTDEEIKSARQKAIDDRISMERSKLERKITVASTKPVVETAQQSLF